MGDGEMTSNFSITRIRGVRQRLLAGVKSSGGYTLVETLVASAIFLGVLLPASLVLAKLAMSRYNHEVMVATQLAKDEMEKTILGESYHDEAKEIVFDKTRWKLVRAVHERFGLIEICVSVFRHRFDRLTASRETKPLVELKTLRASP
jgi:hypothetical protein